MPHRTVDPATLSLPEASRLITHAVTPRPIALVGTRGADGSVNLAPFSYFMAGGANPLSVAISPTTPRDGAPKDTLYNIAASSVWTVSVVTPGIVERANAASASLPYGKSEWTLAGLTPIPGSVVDAPWVAESPIALECRLFQIVAHGDGPGAANYCIGEVVALHLADGLDLASLVTVGRLGGDAYARTTDRFDLTRP